MKIALLLFGHLRNYRMCVDSLQEFLIKQYDCDVFMHTWDETEVGTVSWHPQRTEKLPVDSFEIDYINLKYKPKDLMVEHQEKYDKAETIQLSNGSTTSNIAMHFMFDSMNKANEMRKQYEIKHGIKYDCIIVTRPDVNLLTPLDVEKVLFEAQRIGLHIDNCRFFAHEGGANPNKQHWLLLNGGSDLLFFGRPNTIDKFIEVNQYIDIDYIKNHYVNLPAVFVSKEIDAGIMPVPFAYARGLDWNFSANTARLKTVRNRNVIKEIIRQITRPIFYFEKKHPDINYYKK